MGAYANTAYAYPAVQDPRNSNYYLNAISGTSQACPQVVGLLSCVLQARPWMTQQQCLNWTTSTASTWAVNESYYGGNGYVNFGSLQGSAKLALYNPFNSVTPLTIRG
jgi:subtilisin family serine protease